MFRTLEPWHIIVLVVVLLLLFGSKRLPDAARGLGRSLRIFKAEVKDLRDDDPPTPAPTAPREITPAESRLVDEARAAQAREADQATRHDG